MRIHYGGGTKLGNDVLGSGVMMGGVLEIATNCDFAHPLFSTRLTLRYIVGGDIMIIVGVNVYVFGIRDQRGNVVLIWDIRVLEDSTRYSPRDFIMMGCEK